MQRHGHKQVCLGQQTTARARHQPRHEKAGLGPVAVFKGMHQPGGVIAEQHGSPRPIPDGGISQCGRRKSARALIIGEGRSERVTYGLIDQFELRPAVHAEAGRVLDRALADQTETGCNQIHDAAPEAAWKLQHGLIHDVTLT